MEQQFRDSVRPPAAPVVVAVFLALQLALSFRLNINWDEYWFLSRIFAFEGHRLTDPLQTFHVHLLGPLTALPMSDPDRIVAGRLVMLACECISLACLFAIARKYTDAATAWIVLAAWCAGGFVLIHGASFRTDPLAAACLMGSLALLYERRTRLGGAAAAGVLAALALLVTVKSVFYLPAFAAAFFHACGSQIGVRKAAARFALAAAALVLAGGALWLWHRASLIPAGGHGSGGATRSAGSIAGTVLGSGWIPAASFIAAWLIGGAVLSLLLAGGIAAAVRGAWAGPDKPANAELLLCALPLLSLLLYRNAYPYFFPFLTLPVALAAIPAARAAAGSALVLPVLIAAMLASLALQTWHKWPATQDAQRAYERAAHLAFPQPVAYIDRSNILPSDDGGHSLLSSWGLAGLDPNAMEDRIARDRPPLLILDSPTLEAAVEPGFAWDGKRLSRSDEAALRRAYIPHWGKLWVAGTVVPAGAERAEIAITGRYTLECSGDRMLDGKWAACGHPVDLARGSHRWHGGAATLRWGEHLPRPATPPPVEPIYHGF